VASVTTKIKSVLLMLPLRAGRLAHAIHGMTKCSRPA